MNSLCGFLTVTQIRHFNPLFYNLFHAFAPHFNEFTSFIMFTTFLQFPPHFYNLHHTGIFFCTFVLYVYIFFKFSLQFYHFLHTFIFFPHFYNFSTIYQFISNFYNLLHKLIYILLIRHSRLPAGNALWFCQNYIFFSSAAKVSGWWLLTAMPDRSRI